MVDFGAIIAINMPQTDSFKPDSRRLGVLISGRGTNLGAIVQAIEERRLDAEIGVVISNQSAAGGLARAKGAGIEALVLDHTDKSKYRSREDYDRVLVQELQSRGVGLVCLAGFMRLLSPVFIDAFPNAIMNIHPSLLPAFPGINAQYQAWEHGVKRAGVTVHLVNAELDGGPIVLQEAVAVRDGDDAEVLSARLLELEHQLYPQAIQLVLDGGWRIDGRRFLKG
jgi:phosphoribosylglycinamide formyltransferase-1